MHPDHRGIGLGSALISAGLGVVSAAGGANVALETSSEANVRFYERLGFAVAGTTRTVGWSVVYSMVRRGGSGGNGENGPRWSMTRWSSLTVSLASCGLLTWWRDARFGQLCDFI